MTTSDRLTYLLESISSSQASAEEYEELIRLIDSDPTGDIVSRMNKFHKTDSITPGAYDESYWRTVLQEVLSAGKSIEGSFDEEEETPVVAPVHRVHFLKRRWWAAAAVLVLLGASIWLFLRTPEQGITKTTTAQELKNDVAPGGNKAILTLADNSTIILDSAANGKLAEQGKTDVIKSGNGELVYDAKALTIDHSPLTYNMLSTPRGGQYQLVLPDGSKVWLNAASSIRYPTAFASNERSVDITGEAYFEVAKDAKKPFRVHFISAGRKGAVEVLGTHFNINAYNDEPASKTTLLQGSIKVTKETASVILKPGEQTSVSQSSQPSQPIRVQTNEVVAWKDGLFKFQGADLPTVMRQLVRWYNVEVVYEKGVPQLSFGGDISRNSNLSQVLKILELSGVHARIEQRKVIISM